LRVKICGLTEPDQLAALGSLGVDAVGLNFCDGSPRRLSPDRAEQLLARRPRGLLAVGVFAHQPAAHVAELADRLGLDAVQLHGDEPPEHVRWLHTAGLRVLKAFRLGAAEHLAALEDWLQLATQLDALPEAILLDSAVPGRLGGTGQTLPDDVMDLLAARLPRWDSVLPAWRRLHWVLAGGLTPENLADRLARCPLPISMVDAASGVESAPGRKDLDRVARFIAAARASSSAPV
jgi:phosphoribosylanthranilate isomerase